MSDLKSKSVKGLGAQFYGYDTMDKDQLRVLTIHELRIILKKLGGTPSNKSSNELVEEITYIQGGGKPIRKSNRGRKPKYLKQEIIVKARAKTFAKYLYAMPIDELTPEEFGWRVPPTYANGVYAPVKTVCCDPAFKNSKIAVADGILITEPEIAYVVNYDAHFEYPPFMVERDLIKTYGLVTGDRITGYARSTEDDQFIVYEVEKINDQDKSIFERGPAFKTLKAGYPEERFALDENGVVSCRAVDLFAPIGKGGRVVVIENGPSMCDEFMTAALVEMEKCAVVIDLPINVAPETIADITDSLTKSEVVGSDFCTDCESSLTRVFLYAERAKRLLEQGEDVVLSIRSLDKLFGLLKRVYEEEGEDYALNELKKLLNIARNVKGGGSLTFMCSLSEKHDALLDEVVGVFNCVIRLSREDKFISLGGVDVFSSITYRAEKMYEPEVAADIERLRNRLGESGTELLAKIFAQTSDNDELREQISGYLKKSAL